jgi:hypothetical protein
MALDAGRNQSPNIELSYRWARREMAGNPPDAERYCALHPVGPYCLHRKDSTTAHRIIRYKNLYIYTAPQDDVPG